MNVAVDVPTTTTLPAQWLNPRGWTPRRLLGSALGLLAAIGLTLAIVLAPIDYAALGNYGYLGVFLITLFASASFVLPVPYLAAVLVAGTFLNPIIVGIVAGLACAIGEFTGYLVGRSGRAVIPENRWSTMLQRQMGRYGGRVIFVAAAIPNPFFDVAGILAGASRLSPKVFFVATLLGKTLRLSAVSVVGAAFLVT